MNIRCVTRYVVFALFIGSGALVGQEVASISADRPDQTESAALVPLGYVQAELGLSGEQYSPGISGYSIPGFLIRYGMRSDVELRLVGELLSRTVNGTRSTGLTPIALGLKIPLTQEEGVIPKTSFIGHLSFPGVASSSFRATYLGPSVLLAMEHTLSEVYSISYNLGVEWDGSRGEPTYVYTLVSGVSLSNRVGAYIEVYGFVPQWTSSDHRCDAGLIYKAGDDLLLDLSGGAGLSTGSPDVYVAVGASYRVSLQ